MSNGNEEAQGGNDFNSVMHCFWLGWEQGYGGGQLSLPQSSLGDLRSIAVWSPRPDPISEEGLGGSTSVWELLGCSHALSLTPSS